MTRRTEFTSRCLNLDCSHCQGRRQILAKGVKWGPLTPKPLFLRTTPLCALDRTNGCLKNIPNFTWTLTKNYVRLVF